MVRLSLISILLLICSSLVSSASVSRAASAASDERYPARLKATTEPHIVIIGSGPTGLGAAWRLYELGYRNWTLVEGSDLTGGLAKSVTDENGFIWDHGVHVLFSHYKYFDSMLTHVLPDKEDWHFHTRNSPAYMNGRFVGYPVQNNIWQLPKDQLMECLEGLLEVDKQRGSFDRPKNFKEWVEQGFGKGLAKHFMLPYNFKVWAYPAEEMNTAWVGERVATIDPAKVIHNLVFEKEDITWGPNAKFRYPDKGSGQIWDALFALLPSRPEDGFIHKNKQVTSVNLKDPENKKLIFLDGTSLVFDAIVNTSPIDLFLPMFSDNEKIQELTKYQFKHQSVNLVGIGIKGEAPDHVKNVYWVYFPEEEYIFYRLTVLSNFSPHMVPSGKKKYSIVVEVSESPHRKLDKTPQQLFEAVIDGLKKSNFIAEGAEILTRWHHRFEYGYPVPYVERDQHIHHVDAVLREEAKVWTRGRFGSWKYEVANQDHSFMLGVEAVDNILFGTEEVTFHKPDVVNAGKGEGRKINPPKKGKKFRGMSIHVEPGFLQVPEDELRAVNDWTAHARNVYENARAFGNSALGAVGLGENREVVGPGQGLNPTGSSGSRDVNMVVILIGVIIAMCAYIVYTKMNKGAHEKARYTKLNTQPTEQELETGRP